VDDDDDDDDEDDGGGEGTDEIRRLREAPVEEDPDFEAAFAEMAGPSAVPVHTLLINIS
jgi:hypothetical protein